MAVLETFKRKSVLVGVSASIFSVALFIIAAIAGGTGGVVLATISSAILTTLLLSVVYDAFLKDSFAADIFAAIRVEQSILKVKLREIEKTRTAGPMAPLMFGTVQAMPADPEQWLHTELEGILQACAERKLSVEIILPAPDEPFVESLADRFGQQPHEVRERFARAPRDIVREWDSRSRHSESTLKVYQYQGVPSCGLYLTDQYAWIELAPSPRYRGLDRTSWLLRLERNGSTLSEWVAEQLRVDVSDDLHPIQVEERPLLETAPTEINAAPIAPAPGTESATPALVLGDKADEPIEELRNGG